MWWRRIRIAEEGHWEKSDNVALTYDSFLDLPCCLKCLLLLWRAAAYKCLYCILVPTRSLLACSRATQGQNLPNCSFRWHSFWGTGHSHQTFKVGYNKKSDYPSPRYVKKVGLLTIFGDNSTTIVCIIVMHSTMLSTSCWFVRYLSSFYQPLVFTTWARKICLEFIAFLLHLFWNAWF